MTMRFRSLSVTLAFALSLLAGRSDAAESALSSEVDRLAAAVESKVIAWRRDIHQHPELGNREHRTAKLVADHLRALGYEVRTEVAHTGVIGVLRGGRPGRVVALRADMDALPVNEQVDLPFASKVRTTYNGQDVGVMHACGHDVHTSVLMGVAEVLAGMRERLPGTVKLIFQPAEEGPPAGEQGGAELMLREGAFDAPKPEAVFGLHVMSVAEAGQVVYRPGPLMAAADMLHIRIRGRQTHGAMPWGGIDPVVVSAQVVMGLQTLASRQMNLTTAPVIVTVATVHGGVRNNIIPDEVEMTGTIRTFDLAMQDDLHARIRRTAEQIAAAAGATAEVTIDRGYPVTVNDPALTERMVPTLERALGEANVNVGPVTMGAEDFSYFAREVPGFFFFLGTRPKGQPVHLAAPNHSPHFFVDESTIASGVRGLAHLAVDYLSQ